MPLRPLRLDDLLVGTLRFIRANPVAVLVPPLIALLVPFALQIVVQVSLIGLGRASGGSVVVVLVLVVVAILLTYAIYPPMLATMLSTLVPAVAGRRISLREAWAAGRRNLGGLYGVCSVLLLIGIVVLGAGIGSVAYLLVSETANLVTNGSPRGPEFVSGFFRTFALAVVVALVTYVVWVCVLVWLGFSVPATVVEGPGVGAALRRSVALVRGTWWRVLGIQLLGYLIATVAAFVVLIPFYIVGFVLLFASAGRSGPGAGGIIAIVVIGVGVVAASVLSTSYMLGLNGLLYIDQRIRRERFDLQLLGHADSG